MGILWNDWYHVTCHMYGSWLRGDPRGWRARHHREHVDGDYKNPPALGTYTKLHAYSKSLMKREPVWIAKDLRAFILTRFVERLSEYKVPWEIASLDGIHLHALIQCPDHKPRIIIGIAKQYCTAQLKAQGLALGFNLKLGEGIWATRSHPEPVTGASHYHHTLTYIRNHARRGAEVIERAIRSQNPLADFDPESLLIE